MRLQTIAAGPLAWIITSAILLAQSPKPAELLPVTTVVYAEGIDSQSILQLPFVANVTGSSLFGQVWKTPDAMKLRGGITLAEVALGERLQEALGKLTANGWAIAIDSETKGVVVWAHARDADACSEFYRKLLAVAENDAKSKSRELKRVTYRETDAYEVNGAIIAKLDDYLIVSNKGELAKGIVDRRRDVTAKSATLAGNPRFQEFAKQQLAGQTAASASRTDNAKSIKLARAWIDLKHIQDTGLAKKFFKGPQDNFPAELLVGGVVEVLRGAPTLQATLSSEDKQLHLQFSAPIAKSSISDKYEYFFGKDNSGQAPALIELEGTQANVSLHRDLAQLWQRAGDLFGQKTNDQLAQAETTLTTLFSGRDFVNDILGSIHPELQLIVTQQQFEKAKSPLPQIRLPAFALVTRLRDPQAMQPQMKRIFMSLIGFANVAGAMNQQPQLDLEAFRLESGWEIAATYAVEADRPKDWIVPVQYNFSPTLLMSGENAVIASTQELARAIGDQIKSPAKPLTNSPDKLNSMIRMDGQLLNQALYANRQQLVSQNMVEKGHTQEEASGEVDLVLHAVQLIKSVQVGFVVGDQALLDMKLELNPN